MMTFDISLLVTVHRFSPPQERRIKVQGSGLGKRLKLYPKKARKKCGFCHIIAKYHVPGLWVYGT